MILPSKKKIAAALALASHIAIAIPAELETAPTNAQALFSERQSSQTLKDLGSYQPIELRGIDANSSLPINIRLDEVVTQARLKLNYTLSPSLLPQLSHLKVYMNDEVQATLSLPKDKLGSKQTAELELDPRFFTDYNRLRLQLIGHYTEDCEYPFHTSLWANIGNDSKLELNLQSLALKNDLSILPAPFFDERDNRQLRLPFVFAAQPSLDTLRAAGGLASWFGVLSSYRGTRFPTHLNTLPDGHAVVFATNDERPAALELPRVEAPSIAIMDHPSTPGAKLLLILGRNSADLKIAADALALGKAALSGSKISVQQLDYPSRRKAYDAPLWLQTGRPIRFGELVKFPTDLEAKGMQLATLRVNARLPPDLFTWQSKGIPINLKYRYTPFNEGKEANLSVSINEQFVQAFQLPSTGDSGTKDRFVLPLLENGEVLVKSDLTIPAFQVGSNNQLQFRFNLPATDMGKCQTTLLNDQQAAIDPDSTLDLTHFDHYAAMPNLALFANSGFPFTKFADLAETTVVVPDIPNANEIETMLVALGKMGATTGVTGLRFSLLKASALAGVADTDLLVISSGNKDANLQQWGKDIPALLEKGLRSFSSLTRAQNALYDWFGWQDSRPEPIAGRAILEGDGPLAAITGLQSPLHEGRSIVIFNATDADALGMISNALNDGAKVDRIRGDLSFVRAADVESFRVNDVYYVGELPWWRWLWYYLHRHPLLLALAGVSAGLLLALLAFAALKGITRRRLGLHHD